MELRMREGGGHRRHHFYIFRLEFAQPMEQRLGLGLHSLFLLGAFCFGRSASSLLELLTPLLLQIPVSLLLLEGDNLDLLAQIEHVAVRQCQVEDVVLQFRTRRRRTRSDLSSLKLLLTLLLVCFCSFARAKEEVAEARFRRRPSWRRSCCLCGDCGWSSRTSNVVKRWRFCCWCSWCGYSNARLILHEHLWELDASCCRSSLARLHPTFFDAAAVAEQLPRRQEPQVRGLLVETHSRRAPSRLLQERVLFEPPPEIFDPRVVLSDECADDILIRREEDRDRVHPKADQRARVERVNVPRCGLRGVGEASLLAKHRWRMDDTDDRLRWGGMLQVSHGWTSNRKSIV